MRRDALLACGLDPSEGAVEVGRLPRGDPVATVATEVAEVAEASPREGLAPLSMAKCYLHVSVQTLFFFSDKQMNSWGDPIFKLIWLRISLMDKSVRHVAGRLDWQLCRTLLY